MASALEKLDRAERRIVREQERAEQRMQTTETLVSFAAGRAATQLIPRFVPQAEPLMPAIGIVGAGAAIFKALDPSTKSPGRYLGAAMALATPLIDQGVTFVVDTVSKFANK